MQPRVAKPYPLTMQPVAYVTRRPIVYCVENADHPWGASFQGKARISQGSMQYSVHDPDHLMQMTVFDPKIPLRQEARSQPDQYMVIIAENGAKGEFDTSHWDKQIVSERNNNHVGESRDLWFVSYYLRANQSGRGEMRVGLLSKFR